MVLLSIIDDVPTCDPFTLIDSSTYVKACKVVTKIKKMGWKKEEEGFDLIWVFSLINMNVWVSLYISRLIFKIDDDISI